MCMQIIEHIVVNGSVHTACKQHQRVCMQMYLRVLCERAPKTRTNCESCIPIQNGWSSSSVKSPKPHLWSSHFRSGLTVELACKNELGVRSKCRTHKSEVEINRLGRDHAASLHVRNASPTTSGHLVMVLF